MFDVPNYAKFLQNMILYDVITTKILPINYQWLPIRSHCYHFSYNSSKRRITRKEICQKFRWNIKSQSSISTSDHDKSWSTCFKDAKSSTTTSTQATSTGDIELNLLI